MMTDVTHEHLLTILDDETYLKVCRYMQGCRVSFGKHSIRQAEIWRDYRHMVAVGYDRPTAIKTLAAKNELSAHTIRRIIRKWKRRSE